MSLTDHIEIRDSDEMDHLYEKGYLEKDGGLLSLVEIECSLPTPPSEDTVSHSEETSQESNQPRSLGEFPGNSRSDDDIEEDEEAIRLRTMVAAVEVLISSAGDNPEREGLLKTPERYAKALLSFTKGYHTTVEEVINDAVFHVDDSDNMVIVKDIEVFSLCEHHLVPFMGKIHVGYIPNGRILGLSKIARIVEVFARRFQIQERLTRQVALEIEEILHPQGVAVIMEATHLCMVMRGVEKTSSSTTTSAMLGSFKYQSTLRKEFLSLVGGK